MVKLLKFEFRKMRTQKKLYICTGIMIVLTVLSIVTTNALSGGTSVLTGTEMLPAAVGNSSYLLIAGIFVAIHICEDYEQQTVKSIYARGYTRMQVYTSKLIVAWLSTSMMFMVIMLTSFLAGTFYGKSGVSDCGEILIVIAAQYIVCMANISLFIALSAMLRKSGSAIASTIVVPLVVNVALALIESGLKLGKIQLTEYWVSSLLNNVSVVTLENGKLVSYSIVALIYCILFAGLGAYFSRKVEL